MRLLVYTIFIAIIWYNVGKQITNNKGADTNGIKEQKKTH